MDKMKKADVESAFEVRIDVISETIEDETYEVWKVFDLHFNRYICEFFAECAIDEEGYVLDEVISKIGEEQIYSPEYESEYGNVEE